MVMRINLSANINAFMIFVSDVVVATVRSAAPGSDFKSLFNALRSAFSNSDEGGILHSGPRKVDVSEKWASVVFYAYRYGRLNPSYKPFQILWSISSQINKHMTGCPVTVESDRAIHKCYVESVCDEIEHYRELPILACCLEDTSFVQPDQLEIREYRILFLGSILLSKDERWMYLRELIDRLTRDRNVCSYNAYWID
ncbi:hypothetical protein PHET_11499 [Paragonimus heterotremus]|uniref:Uncharacterized protein n=1 Tax=Paragonimus heterotremus TaxID=100268 RepID=A0A8J4T646_9TREM|nr:hypothetical protein PHET_11499 [Paragonimus heterotremus]